MDVLSILNKSEAGIKVKEFVKTKKFIDYSHQVRLMKLIYEHYAAENASPVK